MSAKQLYIYDEIKNLIKKPFADSSRTSGSLTINVVGESIVFNGVAETSEEFSIVGENSAQIVLNSGQKYTLAKGLTLRFVNRTSSSFVIVKTITANDSSVEFVAIDNSSYNEIHIVISIEQGKMFDHVVITPSLIESPHATGDIGIYISSHNVRNAPQIDFDVVEVVGRNGDLVKWNNRFSNIELTFSCYCQELSSIEILKSWLYSVKDYRRIENDYEPQYYREGYLPNALQIEPFYDGSHYHFDLTFSCKPQKYLKSNHEWYSQETIQTPFVYYSRNEWLIAQLFQMVPSDERPNDDMYLVYNLTNFCKTWDDNMMILNVPDGVEQNIFSAFVRQKPDGWLANTVTGTSFIRGSNELRGGTNTFTMSEYDNIYLIIQKYDLVGNVTLDVYEEDKGTTILEYTLEGMFEEVGETANIYNQYLGIAKPNVEINFNNDTTTESYSDWYICFAVNDQFVKIDIGALAYKLRLRSNYELNDFETFIITLDTSTLDFVFVGDNDYYTKINDCCEVLGDIALQTGTNVVAIHEMANIPCTVNDITIVPNWWTL